MVISGPCKGYVWGNFGMIMVYMFCKVDLLGPEVLYRVELLYVRVISEPLWPIFDSKPLELINISHGS